MCTPIINKAIIWYGQSACLNDAYSRNRCEVQHRISSGCRKLEFQPGSLRNYGANKNNLSTIITVKNASKNSLHLNALQINQETTIWQNKQGNCIIVLWWLYLLEMITSLAVGRFCVVSHNYTKELIETF